MIKTFNTVPICILPQNEHGIHLNLNKIHNFIEKIEPEILKMPAEEKAYQQDNMTARWNRWNILLLHNSEFYAVFKIIIQGIKQFTKYLNFKEEIVYLHSWGNLNRKGQQLPKHAHYFAFAGHIAINAEPSTTTFDWKDLRLNKHHKKIKNVNGQLVLTFSDVHHYTSIWEEDIPRTSIAFDVILAKHIDESAPIPPCFPILLE
jgi:hypothetical protein